MLGFLLTVLHIVVAVFLVLVVLLQTGKRADLAGAFGGGGSQTAFGSRGAATVLSKATTTAAVIFMLTSLGLSILSARGGKSSGTVLGDVPVEESSTAPAPALPEPNPLGGLDSGLPPLDSDNVDPGDGDGDDQEETP